MMLASKSGFEQMMNLRAERAEALDTFSEKLTWIFEHPAMWMVLSGGILFLLLYYGLQAWARRYAPRLAQLEIRTPPLNLPPIALRYMFQKGYDSKTILISVMDAAVQGCYSISWRKKGFVAERKPGANFNRLPEIERDALSRSKSLYWDRVPLGNSPNGVTRRVGDRLQKNLDLAYGRFVKKNTLWLYIGFLLSALIAAGTFLVEGDTDTLKTFAIYLTIFMAFIVIPVVFFLQVVKDRYWYGIFYAVLFFTIGVGILFYLESQPGTPLYSVAFLPLGLINLAFYKKMTSYSRKGKVLMDMIYAYRNYLEKRFDRIAAGEEKLSDSVELLPYAMALDIEEAVTPYFRPLLSRQKYEPYQIFNEIYG